jgi:predicted nicotinamide N-methyase
MNGVENADFVAGRWGQCCAEMAVAANGGVAFDLVICADVLYHCEDFFALIDLIQLSCSKSSCHLIVSFEQRRKDLTKFFNQLLQIPGIAIVRKQKYLIKDECNDAIIVFNLYVFFISS